MSHRTMQQFDFPDSKCLNDDVHSNLVIYVHLAKQQSDMTWQKLHQNNAFIIAYNNVLLNLLFQQKYK
jgi:hypothetical protein